MCDTCLVLTIRVGRGRASNIILNEVNGGDIEERKIIWHILLIVLRKRVALF